MENNFESDPFDQKSADILISYNLRIPEVGPEVAVNEHFAEDAYYWVGGDHQLSGFTRGRDNIINHFYPKLFSIPDEFQMWAISIATAANGRVYVHRGFSGKRDGREFEGELYNICHVVDGKIQSQHYLPIHVDALNELLK